MRIFAFLVLGAAVAPRLAAAEPGAAPPTLRADVGVHAGVVLPQLGSKLGTAVGFKLDGGYVVWRRLAITLAVSYSQPPVDHTVMDPRVPGGSFTSSSTQREFGVLVGGRWRFLPPSSSFNAYAGLGAKVYFLKTLVDGEAAGQAFLENTEQSTRVGGAVFGGSELRAGPGAACLELEIGGSALPHTTTGDVQTTAVSVTLGYRFLIE
jgi:hypothetical protein